MTGNQTIKVYYFPEMHFLAGNQAITVYDFPENIFGGKTGTTMYGFPEVQCTTVQLEEMLLGQWFPNWWVTIHKGTWKRVPRLCHSTIGTQGFSFFG